MLGESLLKDLFGSRYTIGELMRIDQGRQDKARGCKVSLMDTFFTIKEESLSGKVKKLFTGKDSVKVFYITLKLAVTGDTGNPHIVFIQLEPDFSMKNWENNKVRIYCDCADFKYRSAYLLDKRDSIFANDGYAYCYEDNTRYMKEIYKHMGVKMPCYKSLTKNRDS